MFRVPHPRCMPLRLHSGHNITAAIVLLCAVPLIAHAQGYLHSSGIYIADGNNSQIMLRGMGLGGWLVPEGYMLQTSGFANSPTAFRTVVTNLVGSANADQFFTLYRQKYVQRKDIDSLARWGFNSVRLPMHFNLLSSAPGVYLEPGFATVDSLLSWCETNQIYLILDLHCAPGGQNDGNISDYQGFPSLWDSQDFQTWTTQLWKTLAERYATKRWIGGYDLLNETAWSFPSGNKPLRDLLVRITDSIRTVDKNHMIFAEGNWYATDFSALAPAWDTNMAWSFHKYWNVNDYSAFQSYLSLRASTNTPLWMGESGENSNQWFSDAVQLLEAYHIGWSWWTLKKIESISCPLSVKKHPSYDALLKYWNGQGSQPTVAAAVNALTSQALLLDAELCVPRPDFRHALFTMPFSQTRTPWGSNDLPGVLYTVNYDMGRNGSAYLDNDFQNTGGVNGPAYNSGWAYRNDGVDVEACTDALSNGFDVGWSNPGEFLAFTVTVQTTGTYSLKTRVASGGSGGSFKLSFDGADITPAVTVPGTGGWQSWQTVSASPLSLSSGRHDLKLHFLSTNVNINRLEFTLIAAGVDEQTTMPAGFRLAQNYPNPFNPVTTIGFRVPGGEKGPGSTSMDNSPSTFDNRLGSGDWGRESRWVKLAVYDILGREVAVLVNEKKEPGEYSVQFDGSSRGSGIYYYRLEAGGSVAAKAMVLLK